MSRRCGFTLIGMLAALVIIGLLAAALYGLGGRNGSDDNDEGPQTIPGRAMEMAESVECRSNLNQLRQAISTYTMVGDPAPASLEELRVDPITRCPVSGQTYNYDPNSGRVWCEKHPDY